MSGAYCQRFPECMEFSEQPRSPQCDKTECPGKPQFHKLFTATVEPPSPSAPSRTAEEREALAAEIENFEEVILRTDDGPEWSDKRRLTDDEKDMLVAALRSSVAETGVWRDMTTAPKDRTSVLLKVKDRIPREGRPDLDCWQGLQFVGSHPGVCEDGFDIGWGFAAPVGHGGFPDDWFDGWKPLPASPSAPSPAVEREA